MRAFGSEDDTSPRHGSFVLDDVALARELHLSPGEAAQEADQLPTERLEEINRALDEYILSAKPTIKEMGLSIYIVVCI